MAGAKDLHHKRVVPIPEATSMYTAGAMVHSVTSHIILFLEGQGKKDPFPHKYFFPNHLPLIKPLCSSTILPFSLILIKLGHLFLLYFFLTKGKF
jgi:hypothetical protein